MCSRYGDGTQLFPCALDVETKHTFPRCTVDFSVIRSTHTMKVHIRVDYAPSVPYTSSDQKTVRHVFHNGTTILQTTLLLINYSQAVLSHSLQRKECSCGVVCVWGGRGGGGNHRNSLLLEHPTVANLQWFEGVHTNPPFSRHLLARCCSETFKSTK